MMAKEPKNHGRQWTDQEVKQLRQLAKENTQARVIGLKLERTEEAIRSKTNDENVSLEPINQSPYSRTIK